MNFSTHSYLSNCLEGFYYVLSLHKKSKINKNIEIRRSDLTNYFADMDIAYHVISITRASELKNADLRVVTRNSFLFPLVKFCIRSTFNHPICALPNENVIAQR